MSWAMRNASRDRPSRKSPAIASRGAKPIEWTKPSNCGQASPSCANSALDLGVVGDVAVEHQLGAELGGEFGDALLEALALVAEGQLGAFAAAGAGDAVGDRAVVSTPVIRRRLPARNPMVSPIVEWAGFSHAALRIARAAPTRRGVLDSRVLAGTWRRGYNPAFPRKLQVGGFFQPIFFA